MRKVFLLSSILILLSCTKQEETSTIKVVGQMKDVMWKGALEGKISTDSFSSSSHYGLGPIAYLKGEVLLFEGQTFISKVIDNKTHEVSSVNSIQAPFFCLFKRQ
jgi:acetolactate decarboxylase